MWSEVTEMIDTIDEQISTKLLDEKYNKELEQVLELLKKIHNSEFPE